MNIHSYVVGRINNLCHSGVFFFLGLCLLGMKKSASFVSVQSTGREREDLPHFSE